MIDNPVIPNFDRDRWEGQMNPDERQALYDLTMSIKPLTVVEVGTARGGGSTYFISSAMYNHGYGHLYSMEVNPEYYEYARNLYKNELSYLASRITLINGNSLEEMPKLLRLLEWVDIAFIDGGEDSMLCLYDFCILRPYIRLGGYVAVHDWLNEKATYIKPVLTNEHDFEPISTIRELAIFQRQKEIHTGRILL